LLVAGLFWGKSTAGWWLIRQTNRVLLIHVWLLMPRDASWSLFLGKAPFFRNREKETMQSCNCKHMYLFPLNLFVWLMADGWCWFVLREKYWLLVADLFWEKSIAGWWLISQANRVSIWNVCSFLHSYKNIVLQLKKLYQNVAFLCSAAVIVLINSTFVWRVHAHSFWDSERKVLFAGCCFVRLFWDKTTAVNRASPYPHHHCNLHKEKGK
jgi:hypothetical protein